MPRAGNKEYTPIDTQRHRLLDLFICLVHLIYEMVLHGEEGACTVARIAQPATQP